MGTEPLDNNMDSTPSKPKTDQTDQTEADAINEIVVGLGGKSNKPQEAVKPQENHESGTPKKPLPIDNETQLELNEYAQALASEFKLANKELTADSEIDDLKRYWKTHVANAAATIVWLALNARSEGVRGNMSKYILDEAYSTNSSSDELADILKTLTTVAGNK